MMSSPSTTATILALLWFLRPAIRCHGISVPKNNNRAWQEKIMSKVIPSRNGPSTPTKEEQGASLLLSLNLTSSTDPKAFSVEPKSIPTILAASLPAMLRVGTGVFAEGYKVELIDADPGTYTIATVGGKQLLESSQVGPSSRAATMEPIVLYDREGDPGCRLVREACSILSLTVQIRPCPSNGLQFVSALARTQQLNSLPILMDPNTGIELKDDIYTILNYLFKTYGNGQLPWSMQNPAVAQLTSTLAMASRFGVGSRYSTSAPPTYPLVLWAYESSPFCKIVTERLGSLELEHQLIYCPRGSSNRQRLMDTTGRFQVPYLEDPNTGVQLWESSAICEYLTKQYGLKTSVTYL